MNAEQIAYYETMERCNKAFLNALSAGRGPSDIVWAAQPRGKTIGDRYTLDAVKSRHDLAESLRTDRDVCFRCGARGDAGCGHR